MEEMTSGAGESSRAIYLECCERIASAFEIDGYRYSGSTQHLARTEGIFRFKIAFQSSRNNEAGELVAIWIHGNVHSSKLKKWREANPALRSPSDIVAGDQIGNLSSNSAKNHWNVANPVDRGDEISNAIHAIRSVVLPYFSIFDDIPSACELMICQDIPGTWLIDVLDFLMCFSNERSARMAAVNFLKRRPDLERAYRSAFERFTRRGIPNQGLGVHAQALAAASIVYKFGDLLEN